MKNREMELITKLEKNKKEISQKIIKQSLKRNTSSKEEENIDQEINEEQKKLDQ